MKNGQIQQHFQDLEQQRKLFYHNPVIQAADPWKSLQPGKWSIGETLYHLILMVKMLRRFSYVYIPIMLPIAHLRRKNPYQTKSRDIYKGYQDKKKRPMKAPFIINPPAGLENKYSFTGIQEQLEMETKMLKERLQTIEEDIAGHIRYPDPIADYPNLIQCVHLLAIHEHHHFEITERYLTSPFINE
ncbi:MAG TPA: DinB family protein [Lentibacillus sp.]|uniref:DinB family protein n=1 Tax=Lentibacillus sp. TaxID=1925746 RepID=UPI002B4B027E|nr:DinB family protein [Lentibacillus sp.]HLR63556.1 DinB family protein [Lentibacillus sp.]